MVDGCWLETSGDGLLTVTPCDTIQACWPLIHFQETTYLAALGKCWRSFRPSFQGKLYNLPLET